MMCVCVYSVHAHAHTHTPSEPLPVTGVCKDGFDSTPYIENSQIVKNVHGCDVSSRKCMQCDN